MDRDNVDKVRIISEVAMLIEEDDLPFAISAVLMAYVRQRKLDQDQMHKLVGRVIDRLAFLL